MASNLPRITSKDALIQAIHSYLHGNPNSYDEIGNWDISAITDMSYIFRYVIMDPLKTIINTREKNELVASISNWDVSHVTNMDGMFSDCTHFNHPLDWDVSNVISMAEMFINCSHFNQPLNWNVSRVTSMRGMFTACSLFNQSLDWDTRNVRDMSHMFGFCEKLNSPIKLKTQNVRSMESMFIGCSSFNQPLDFNVRNVTNMSRMFEMCDAFSQNLDDWAPNTGKLIFMSRMFYDSPNFPRESISNWICFQNPNLQADELFRPPSRSQRRRGQRPNTQQPPPPTSPPQPTPQPPQPPQPTPPQPPQPPQSRRGQSTRGPRTNEPAPPQPTPPPPPPPPPRPTQLTRFSSENPVRATPMRVNNNTPSILDKEAFDLIEGTNLSVREEIEKTRDASPDDKPIFLLYNNNVTITTREMILTLLRTNEGSVTRYECNVEEDRWRGPPPLSKLENPALPYFSMRMLGPIEGIVPLSQIKYLLDNPDITAVKFVKTSKIAKSSASLQIIRLNEFNGTTLGSAHCQKGMPEDIYTLVDISSGTVEASTASGRRTKKHRSKRTKRRRSTTKRTRRRHR